MSSDELTSPEDPEWVDAIVRRALERAAADPAAALDTTEPSVPPVASPESAPAREATPAPRSQDPPHAEPQDAGSVAPRGRAGDAVDRPDVVDRLGPVGPADGARSPGVDPTYGLGNGQLLGEESGGGLRQSAAVPQATYPFDPDDPAGGVDERLFEDALALEETHDAAVSSRMRSFLEWGAVIVGALAVALLIKTFLMQAYFIPSSSMESTLEISDRVLVNKLSYAVGDVSRGDLVVFTRPPTQAEGEPDLIKRVIGLGGETIQFRDGQVFIKEPGGTEYQLLREPYLDEGVTTRDFPAGLPPNCLEDSADTGACTIPEGHLFMMGDNRSGSSDSRVFGPVDEDSVVGRAFLRVWPLSRLGFL